MHIVDNKKFNSTFKDDKMEEKNDNTHDINESLKYNKWVTRNSKLSWNVKYVEEVGN